MLAPLFLKEIIFAGFQRLENKRENNIRKFQ